jgi:hypothetical protein
LQGASGADGFAMRLKAAWVFINRNPVQCVANALYLGTVIRAQ